MQTRHLLALSTLAVATSALAADNNFDRTLQVSGAPTVIVNTGSGYIHLRAGSDSQVHVAAHLHSSNNGWFGGGNNDAQSRIEQIVANPPVHQSGNEIEIGERHSGDQYRNISIDYEITLPRASTIEAGTGSGDIESQDVGGNFRAASGSGSVRARAVHGPAILQSGSGDIELDENGQGEIRAQTGSGSIRLHNIDGALRAQTGSGDIEASGKITADSKLQTGSGSIRLTLGAAGFNLDATTGSGTIRTQSPITTSGDLNHHHITGAVNGGGPSLRMVTGSGDIEIK